VERIEPFGFQSCTGLLYFTFGSTLQNIGANGFSDCTNVAVITSHATTPPVCGEQALADINFWDCKLYVPAESLDAYAAADQWKLFFAEPLDEPEPSIPGDINGDSDVDVFTAQNSGLQMAGVSWGFRGKAELQNAGAPFVADTADELLAYLVRL
jgi:hypothetical protein